MKLVDFAHKYYESQADCARAIGISPAQLNNMVHRNKSVAQLMDGRWIVLNKNTKFWDIGKL